MKKNKLTPLEIKKYYDESSYYEKNQRNFADKKTRFKAYMIKNIFNIYYPEKKEKILDVGCGWGNISLELQRRGFNVTGLDYSKKSIEICKKTAKILNLDETKFVCQDATDTKSRSNSFDVIYCADLVEHLYPEIYLDLIRETHRILKKGGKFIIYTPNPSHSFEVLKRHNIILKKDISHVDYKTMDRLKNDLAGNGFLIKKADYMESHIPILNIIERVFIKIIPLLRRRNAVLAIKQ